MFNKSPTTPIKLTIRPSQIKALKRGHPWVYESSLNNLPQAKSGSFAVLRDLNNKILAKGMYDPNCQIVFRVCALEEELNEELIKKRIDSAISMRDTAFSSDTNCYRLINGEGDLLPGLICDKFNDTGVIQLDGAGPSNFWDLDILAKYIAKSAALKHIYFKPRSNSNQKAKALVGTLPITPISILEYGAKFETNLIDGQKTGFFLDQRENRQLIRSLAKDRSVLNLFGYTGGFSVAAGLGEAKSVATVDMAKPAIIDAIKNWEINKLNPKSHLGVCENAFDYLASQVNNKKYFDLVICDPPSFVASKAALEKGRGAYISIFSQAAKVVSPNCLLALASCSSHISQELFLEICEEALGNAKRHALTLHISGQPLDHPFPLACKELRYLKFILLRLN